jgi:hypothetical protein
MYEVEFGLSRDAYNAFVQSVQSEAAAFHMELRTRVDHHDDGRIDGYVEVFWERWQTVAAELRAMTAEASRTIYPARWEGIKGRATDELVRS